MWNRCIKIGQTYLQVGSFQTFVENYRDADCVLREWESNPLSETAAKSFHTQFEKLVILDYIIRNTGDENRSRLVWPTSPFPRQFCGLVHGGSYSAIARPSDHLNRLVSHHDGT